jgi:hypothetical protein
LSRHLRRRILALRLYHVPALKIADGDGVCRECSWRFFSDMRGGLVVWSNLEDHNLIALCFRAGAARQTKGLDTSAAAGGFE